MNERQYFEQFIGDTPLKKVRVIQVFSEPASEKMLGHPFARDSKYIDATGEIRGSVLPARSGLAVYHLVKFENVELGQAWFKPEFLEAAE
jgi:hypothetical protein